MIRRPPRSTLFPTRRSSDLASRIIRGASALAVALACACSSKTGGDANEGDGKTPQQEATVTVTKVARGGITSWMTITGTVAALPNQDVRVSSLVPGRIAKMMATEGDRVHAGQVLAKIED